MKHKGKRVKEGSRPSTVNGKVPPRRVPNAERRPREYLTPEEAERLITTARKRIGARNPHRDATMIMLAYRHGLRASEVCALRWDMIDLSQGRYHVTRRKNGRPSVHLLRGQDWRDIDPHESFPWLGHGLSSLVGRGSWHPGRGIDGPESSSLSGHTVLPRIPSFTRRVRQDSAA